MGPHGVLHPQEAKGKDRLILSITWLRKGDEATGSRERPAGHLASLAESSVPATADLDIERKLMPVAISPISVPFCSHVVEWLAQRLPEDLHVKFEDGSRPPHIGVQYAEKEYHADWCP